MHKTTLFRVFLVTLALIAVGCSSGESGDDTTVDGFETDDTASTDTIGLESTDGPANPESVRALASSLTGADIGGDELTCLVETADGDNQLTAVYNGAGTPDFQFTPEAFTALAVSIHRCVDVDVLNASLLGLAGAAEESAETAFSECMGGYLSADQTGDLAYTGLAALSVGFPVPEGAQDATIEASRGCIGAENLANQLAANAEQATAFASEVDRDCVADGIGDEFLDSFWNDVITNTGPTEGLESLITGCTSAYDSGLPKEIPADFVPWAGSGLLAGVDPATRNAVYDGPPPDQLEDGIDYQAILTTEDGEIVVDLYEDVAPIAVNAFVSLARDGFYDGTRFHRVLRGFIAQAGDPTNTGSGGPGYSFDDEASGLTPIDQRGLLAMANSGVNTNGSQFFITLDAATHLDGLHVVFGEIVSGENVLDAIELRDPAAPVSRGELLLSVEIIEQ